MPGYLLPALRAARGGEPISDVARRALVSDRTIINAENGGNTRRPECDRLAIALGRASLVVNNVTNATLTVTAVDRGEVGRNLTIALVAGVGNNVALAAVQSGNAITVTLGTDGGGAADDTKNTGTLVAAAIDALSSVSCTTSGTGAGIVAPVAAQSLALTADLSLLGAVEMSN